MDIANNTVFCASVVVGCEEGKDDSGPREGQRHQKYRTCCITERDLEGPLHNLFDGWSQTLYGAEGTQTEPASQAYLFRHWPGYV